MQGPSFPYPLSSWTLGGFRAIRDETRLELGGLNLLVGANSAGKSSVLHSILLAAQTLTAPTADRPLVLNGPQVRLGWADDCVHEEAGNEITIGFGLNPSGLEFGHGRPAIAELAQLTVLSRFVVPPQDPSSFHLARSEVTALLAEESAKASIAIVPRTAEKERAALEAAGIAAEAVDDNLAAIGMGVEGDIPDRTVGVHPRQFLPHTLAVVTNAYIAEPSQQQAIAEQLPGIPVNGSTPVAQRGDGVDLVPSREVREEVGDTGHRLLLGEPAPSPLSERHQVREEMQRRGAAKQLTMHPRRRGHVEFQRGGTPRARKHAGKNVFARMIKAMRAPPAAQVQLAQAGDAEHKANRVECVRGHGLGAYCHIRRTRGIFGPRPLPSARSPPIVSVSSSDRAQPVVLPSLLREGSDVQASSDAEWECVDDLPVQARE